MIVDSGKYFLYRHIRLDTNQVFYIGIGKKLSNFKQLKTEYYRAFSKKGRNAIWYRIVNKTDYRVEILFESQDNQFIKEKEIEFIKLYGRIDNNTGTLCNFTDGGDGCNKFIPNQEQIKKMKICQSKHKIPFLSLNLDGTIFKKFDGVTDCANYFKLQKSNLRKLAKNYKNENRPCLKMKDLMFCYLADYDGNKKFVKSEKLKNHLVKMNKSRAKTKEEIKTYWENIYN